MPQPVLQRLACSLALYEAVELALSCGYCDVWSALAPIELFSCKFHARNDLGSPVREAANSALQPYAV